jgi:hypothetical protein
MRMKIRASPWDLASVSPGKEGMIAKYRDRKKAEELRKRDPRAVRIMDEETILFVGENVLTLLREKPAAPAPAAAASSDSPARSRSGGAGRRRE